ncbi:ankyrin [Lophium mytilinum]|uniref:Ankyrin n=1 Tax=Lophium mytilinum TaxID=390894 RepID=A0A6A6QPR6_9PEZI|nr:ankyrin [Lophium mytilinum]
MAEVVAVTGGIASIAQILVYTVKTVKVITDFCDDLRDAPTEFSRIKYRIILLQSILSSIHDALNASVDDGLLPPQLRRITLDAIRSVYDSIINLQRKCLISEMTNEKTLKNRFKWVMLESRSAEKLLTQLRDAEGTLSTSMQLLTCRNTMLNCIFTRQITENLRSSQIRVDCPSEHASDSLHTQTSSVTHSKIPPSRIRSSPLLLSSSIIPVLYEVKWLRRFGFYASITSKSIQDGHRTSKLHLEYKFPAWICAYILSYEATITLPRCLTIQTQVPEDSPFMLACSQGDIALIRQHLSERPDLLHCRTAQLGKTPLLLAIGSQNVEAVTLLLNEGVNPNMGDDSRVLPVFAALGYKSLIERKVRKGAPCGPCNTDFIDIIRVLVQHNASVHEVIDGKTLTMLYIAPERYPHGTTTDFFGILISESYVDFDYADERGMSALFNAVGSGECGAAALRVLSQVGVQMERILPDGRTLLHLAAELADSAKILQHVYETYGVQEVNRQDKYGWTPLHYSLTSRSHRFGNGACWKVRYLMEKGADPCIQGVGLVFCQMGLPFNGTARDAYELSSALGPELHAKFLEALQGTGSAVVDDSDTEVFEDAEETLEQATICTRGTLSLGRWS